MDLLNPSAELVAFYWMVLLAAQLADIWTTNKVLSQGGREKNPIVQWVMDNFGNKWGLIKALFAFGGAAAMHYSGYPIGILAAAAVVGAVAAKNYTYIK